MRVEIETKDGPLQLNAERCAAKGCRFLLLVVEGRGLYHFCNGHSALLRVATDAGGDLMKAALALVEGRGPWWPCFDCSGMTAHVAPCRAELWAAQDRQAVELGDGPDHVP